MNYLDLFSGIGGFHQALIEASVKINYSAFSEIDKHATKLYESKFNSEKLGDIRSIKPVSGKLNGNKIDLITFGFPCQDLSLAGERKGFGGNRSSLFFEATRLIKELQPAYFVFENVKGFFSSNGGKDFILALREIANIGYDGEWQLVNTNWFLPQNRERIFFVGHPRGGDRRQIFPLLENDCAHSPRKRDEVQQANTLTTRQYQSWRGTFIATPVLSPDRLNRRQNGRRFKDDGDDCFTLTCQDRHGIFDGKNIRRLTPKECERLQGFPDDWTANFSDNQRYKMLGNAISVPVAKKIFQKLYQLKNQSVCF